MKLFSEHRVYLDHASATSLDLAVAKEMSATHHMGNPGAIHREGVEAANSLQSSRERIARCLACKAREIVFTSGITESNTLAIVGYARAEERLRQGLKGTHWVTSSTEHPSVLEAFSEIERLGGAVTHVAPDAHGRINISTLTDALRPETVFVSIAWANNEIGTVQSLSKIASALRAHEKKHDSRITFHADAGQAPLYLAPSVNTLGVDLFSFSPSKLHGPHGIGALFISNDTALLPVLFGGEQERALRPGTENVSLAAGFAKAMERAGEMREREWMRLKGLRDRFMDGILKAVPDAMVNGDGRHALPHILNISIPGIQSEYVVLALDARGVALSTKSACKEGEKSSHVVEALGGEPWRAENTLRFSLGRDTREKDLQRALRAIADIVPKARTS